jgi:hypothetical protein
MHMRKKQIQLLLLAAAMLVLAACARKKKADDFQSFVGISYNAAPLTLQASLGLDIAVQPIDINFDGKMDGLYICRTGGFKKITLDAPGAGYTDSPVVNFTTTNCTTPPTAVAVVANGRVERIQITNPGAGCTSAQVQSITGGSGAGASASVTALSKGQVTRISMQAKGAGYAAPSITITGGGGSSASAGVNVSGGAVTGVYALNPGDGLYTSAPTIVASGDTGAGALMSVAPADVVVSELDPTTRGCNVTYDPTNATPSLRHIPQMLFTWPTSPTTGLDTNGDGNADYYLYTENDGTSRVMTNADGSGAVAKLITKNPLIDETNDWLYEQLAYGQVIGFDVLGNNTIGNNILGKIALDRDVAAYVDAGDPKPIISPIKNDEFYGAPLDVNVLCSDKVACNALTYSLSNAGAPIDPDFGSTNLDLTGQDFTGTKHAIKAGDSGTLSFQNLPYGNYYLKYQVRDAAGRLSASSFDCAAATPVNCIRFTVGLKPVISIFGVNNRYVSSAVPATPAVIQWSADTGSLTKKFRYLVIANGSCIGYTRANYITPPGSVLASGGPVAPSTVVNSTVTATGSGMVLNDNSDHGINYITICAITCETAACAAASDLSVWGDAYETVIRDDTPPTLSASPLSGIYATPQAVVLTGGTTTASSPTNGTLIPAEICYTWGADASGNPLAATNPANPTFPCTASSNVVKVTGSQTTLNVGCAARATVTDTTTNTSTCTFNPGIYYIKFAARDAAGNVSAVQTVSYAIGVTPTVTILAPPADKHVWTTPDSWGNTATAVGAPRTTTSINWQSDFPGTYAVKINSSLADCSDGTLSTHASATGTAVALTPVAVTVKASDLTVGINTVKICLAPSGGGATTSASVDIWRVQPININSTYTKVNYNVGDTITLDVANDLFTPINAIKSITFSCPAGSTGVDANNGCVLPTATGTVVHPGVNTTYQLPATTNVTTLAYDVSITLCDTTPADCSTAAVGPTFSTNNNGGSTTAKVFILQDKTAGNSIFVDAAAGADGNAGTVRTAPKKSLSSAMTAASGGKAVYVIGGNYCGFGSTPCGATTGTLTIPVGTSVYGGFTSAWYRPNVASNRAAITAGSTASATSVGMDIGSVTTPTRIEGIQLTTQPGTSDLVSGVNTIGLRVPSGGSSSLTLYKNSISVDDTTQTAVPTPGGSYGVYAVGTGGLVLNMVSNAVIVGKGGIGLAGGSGGTNGAPGQTGGNGAGGIQGTISSNSSHSHASGGTGGIGGVAGFNTGGNGGAGGWQDDGNDNADGGEGGGYTGQTAPNGGGAGGAGASGSCGGNGTTGAVGSTGGGGSNGAFAGAQNYGQISGGFIVAYKGTNATDGADGRGGGGGGGGAHAECFLNDSGGGGGGGGGGGAKGIGGESGHAGGPSIGIFLDTVATITMTSNTITRNTGGNGGSGQSGGTGGSAGGAGGGGSGPDDGGNGGNGGNGGAGGDGGDGAGGYGGSSMGLVIKLAAAPTLTCSGNSYGGGAGGSGGSSTGASGGTGLNTNCFRFSSQILGATCTCN